MENIFKLYSTYEYFTKKDSLSGLIRIEIFNNIKNKNMFRCRVWESNIYNVYPASINTDRYGHTTNFTHSADYLNAEITKLIFDSEDYISGVIVDSDVEFLKEIISRIETIWEGERK